MGLDRRGFMGGVAAATIVGPAVAGACRSHESPSVRESWPMNERIAKLPLENNFEKNQGWLRFLLKMIMCDPCVSDGSRSMTLEEIKAATLDDMRNAEKYAEEIAATNATAGLV